MSTRHLRIFLWTIAGALALATVAILAWSFTGTVAVQMSVVPSRPAKRVDAKEYRRPSLPQLQTAFAIELRRPLVDPAPQAVLAAAPAMMLKLAGTVIEPGNCRAMLQLPDGRIELKRVGEQSGGAQLLSIEENSVTVLFQGQQLTLRTDRKKQSG